MIVQCYEQKVASVWYKVAQAGAPNSINMLHMAHNKLSLLNLLSSGQIRFKKFIFNFFGDTWELGQNE